MATSKNPITGDIVIKINHNGKIVTRETKRQDTTHVMVCERDSGFKIMGTHKTEAKAKADARKMAKAWGVECFVYPVDQEI